jgi:hypothetical protein
MKRTERTSRWVSRSGYAAGDCLIWRRVGTYAGERQTWKRTERFDLRCPASATPTNSSGGAGDMIVGR